MTPLEIAEAFWLSATLAIAGTILGLAVGL